MNSALMDWETHSRISKLEDQVERLWMENERYRIGLMRIVQMERFPTQSGSQEYDGIYPTGAFALKVLKGED
ncbi:hypothetical protein UFOVP155_7 [uncultured Caudovirales phage]|uniref:Uncharacterized protein n=1 Tax=uncultured Caudovirales phage TaxID=2100421 RepID=A0A6J7WDV9_9CAUD|nr:hypothetical protein UFOVP155_7 [uncultured Caudovirales phage]